MSELVTLDQVKELIKSENLKPSDLFEAGQIVADPIVKGYSEDRIRERIGSEFKRRKDAEEALEASKAEHEPKMKALQDEISGLKISAAKAQVGSLFEKQKTERKLDERQVKFIQSRLPRFTPQKPEDLEKEFLSHLDAEIDEYNVYAKDVFGIDPTKGNDRKDGDPGTGPDDGKGGGDESSKYIDPKTNPFIRAD